ncbi:hypothetical protein BG015_011380 [Linnemannia schmuckeri]|uniref:Uncharacterized protein n=1 Tax=Linnemannia schmuckeri TaxID=64567 RepID=A0A9P5RSN4_9FUNG|nr:hypothetical protein BG015_011380 [Linnemannia schmuckeri]
MQPSLQDLARGLQSPTMAVPDERVSEWDLMGGTLATPAAAAATGAMKKTKKVTMAIGSRGEARRHSLPEATITNADGSSSSSLLDVSTAVAGTSSSGTNMPTKDDVTGLDYDGDDEDEDYYSGERWIELLITLTKQNPSLEKICIMMERFEPTAAFWESIEQATNARSGNGKNSDRGGGGKALYL